MSISEVAALYARVSTSNQEEEATIESQVAAIETHVNEQGYILTDDHRYLDQAVSGAYLARPELDRLRHQVTDGLISVVVCYSPDRLARNYAHQLVLLSELKRCGVRIEFVNQPPLADTPQGQLLLSIQGVFAEYERELIKERLRLGRLHKLRSGQCLPVTTPYGYRYIPLDQPNGGQWVINETEAEVVRAVYRPYSGCV